MARIGLLSDSHGRAATTRRGVELLLARGAEMLVHLGDVGTIEVIDELVVPRPQSNGAGEAVECHLVFGNVDWDSENMGRYAESLGIHVHDPVGSLELPGDRRLLFTHGHDEAVMRRALESGAAYVCHGHSHRTRDERLGEDGGRGPASGASSAGPATRVINPGALFRASAYTVALLDTDKDDLQFLDINGG